MKCHPVSEMEAGKEQIADVGFLLLKVLTRRIPLPMCTVSDLRDSQKEVHLHQIDPYPEHGHQAIIPDVIVYIDSLIGKNRRNTEDKKSCSAEKKLWFRANHNQRSHKNQKEERKENSVKIGVLNRLSA